MRESAQCQRRFRQFHYEHQDIRLASTIMSAIAREEKKEKQKEYVDEVR